MDDILPHLDHIRYLPPTFHGGLIELVFCREGRMQSVVVTRPVFRCWEQLRDAVKEQTGIDAPGPGVDANAEEIAFAWEKVADDELFSSSQLN